jgi:hypothetical protein
MEPVAERLEYLRSQIRAECISYSELSELQSLADQIEPGDVELLEWAGVPEFPEPADLFTNQQIAEREAACKLANDTDLPSCPECGHKGGNHSQQYGCLVETYGELCDCPLRLVGFDWYRNLWERATEQTEDDDNE